MIFNSSKYNTEWNTKRLSDLGKFQRGKSRHRPRNDSKLFEHGTYPLVQTGEVKAANLYIRTHEACYNDFGLSQSAIWPENTLCITIAANIAETALLGYPMCFPDSVVGFNAYPEESSELFMHYVFTYIRKAIQNSASGSIQDNINIEYLTGLRFKIPHKTYQDKIAEILSSLDKKIELNNRINAELEAMAKTLYEYWFVQFDFPDANGKPYKASGGKMVYNDTLKREIPQDWKVNKLVEITSLIRRGISPKYTEESGTQVLNQKCIRNQKISFEDSRRHQAIMDDNDERLLKPFDVLVNSTGVGTLGRVAYVKRLAEKKTTVDSHVSIVRANPDKVCPRYLAWKLMRYQPVIEAAANGSTGQVELSKSFLEDLDVIIPSGSVAKKFSEFVEPIAISVAKRESENEQLISLRDWLLPMLMNGQVTVKPSTEPQEAQHG
ncbi:restriction endonuclease subunit S [Shewanella algae]|uniref:Type I restriction modification protein n=1 Tax=Shewanella algae TaxID=38313 RepID=A0AAD1NQ66_9GAMM|nr:restriction endonuclease subunit S [Shewanella algae]BCV47296.1 type I restriction modification protein [Shewanella algae]